MLLLLALVFAFILFANGYVCADVEACGEGIPFFTSWNIYIKDSQDGKIGTILMKTFYFIPTTASFFSWCKFKLKTALEKDLG